MKKSEKRRLAARLAAPAPSPEPCADECAVMEVAVKAGKLLLENGAEIFRVEETMERICRYYHVENPSFFVLSNGNDDDLYGGDARRKNKTVVVAMGHDNAADDAC